MYFKLNIFLKLYLSTSFHLPPSCLHQVSPQEMVQEIHQVLMDREDTCHRTCFSLQLDGNVLDNFAELKSIEGLQEGSLLKVVEGQIQRLLFTLGFVLHSVQRGTLKQCVAAYFVLNSLESLSFYHITYIVLSRYVEHSYLFKLQTSTLSEPTAKMTKHLVLDFSSFVLVCNENVID